MGPSLRDSLWTYGGEDTQLYSTIVEGRPAGMPAWGAMLSQDQIWKLITYIRSLRTLDEPDQVSVK
jgi:cytochrome c oxidase cbb3-type subunit 3